MGCQRASLRRSLGANLCELIAASAARIQHVSFEVWLAFVAASAVVCAIPGPTVLTLVSYSLANGRRANLPLVLAVALGDSTGLLLSLLGLGMALAASALWFTAVKVVGGLYLIYLGITLLRAGVPATAVPSAPPGSRWRVFANQYLVTALNPKTIVFFVAFLPQFIDRQAELSAQLWVLAFTFVVMATANALLYAVFAASTRELLTSSRAQRRFNIAGGSLLTAAGIWALLAKRIA
jgi:threonine/homoserine/homoserine lactone efflux protein